MFDVILTNRKDSITKQERSKFKKLIYGKLGRNNMKGNIILSIIIPNYNKGISLEKCLDSIKKQVNSRVEVIIVDDCSSDDSMEILKKYNDFKILRNKENSGVSYSRNAGIEVSKGKYITFIDSDDFVFDNYVDVILKKIELEKDLYIFNVMKNNKKEYSFLHNKSINIDELIQMFPEKYLSAFVSYWVWNKVFKRSIINKFNIRFININYAEDENFCFDYFSVINDIYFIDEKLYMYYETDNGLSSENSLYADAFDLVSNNNLKMFLDHAGNLDILNKNISLMYQVGLNSSKSNADKKKMKKLMNKIQQNINN